MPVFTVPVTTMSEEISPSTLSNAVAPGSSNVWLTNKLNGLSPSNVITGGVSSTPAVIQISVVSELPKEPPVLKTPSGLERLYEPLP